VRARANIDFLGVSNLIPATAERTNGSGRCRVRLADFEIQAGYGDLDSRGDVMIVVRPERVQLGPHGETGENRIPGMIERVVYVGPVSQLMVRLASGQLVQAMVANQGIEPIHESGTLCPCASLSGALRVLASRPPAPVLEEETTIAPPSG
jgi:hypothetical protein